MKDVARKLKEVVIGLVVVILSVLFCLGCWIIVFPNIAYEVGAYQCYKTHEKVRPEKVVIGETTGGIVVYQIYKGVFRSEIEIYYPEHKVGILVDGYPINVGEELEVALRDGIFVEMTSIGYPSIKDG